MAHPSRRRPALAAHPRRVQASIDKLEAFRPGAACRPPGAASSANIGEDSEAAYRRWRHAHEREERHAAAIRKARERIGLTAEGRARAMPSYPDALARAVNRLPFTHDPDDDGSPVEAWALDR